MTVIKKHWIVEYTQRNGEKFYTAHIKILGFLNIRFIQDLCMPFGKDYGIYLIDRHSIVNEPYKFKTWEEANEELKKQIEIIENNNRDEINSKVVSKRII